MTIECVRRKKCGYITDIEITSETNPDFCPKCGGRLVIAGTNTDYQDYEDPDYEEQEQSEKEVRGGKILSLAALMCTQKNRIRTI